MCLSIQQTEESAQLVEILKMPELTTLSVVAQDQNGSKGTMESALLSTTWLRLGDWHQSGKQDSCSLTEEDRETATYSMEVKGC